jgi:hypothetical protein
MLGACVYCYSCTWKKLLVEIEIRSTRLWWKASCYVACCWTVSRKYRTIWIPTCIQFYTGSIKLTAWDIWFLHGYFLSIECTRNLQALEPWFKRLQRISHQETLSAGC